MHLRSVGDIPIARSCVGMGQIKYTDFSDVYFWIWYLGMHREDSDGMDYGNLVY